VSSRPFVVFAEPDQRRGGVIHKVRYNQPFPKMLEIEISSFIYQCRKCLDQLAVALAIENGAITTKRTYFPICETLDKFNAHGRGKIKKLASTHQTIIEKNQPFNTDNQSLVFLHQLNLVDKHNRPIITSGLIGNVGVGNGGGSLEIGGNVATWSTVGTVREIIWIGPNSRFDFEFTVRIGFSEDQGLPNIPLIELLERIIDTVQELVSKFK